MSHGSFAVDDESNPTGHHAEQVGCPVQRAHGAVPVETTLVPFVEGIHLVASLGTAFGVLDELELRLTPSDQSYWACQREKTDLCDALDELTSRCRHRGITVPNTLAERSSK